MDCCSLVGEPPIHEKLIKLNQLFFCTNQLFSNHGLTLWALCALSISLSYCRSCEPLPQTRIVGLLIRQLLSALPWRSWSAARSGQSPPSSGWWGRPERNCGSCRLAWRYRTTRWWCWTSDRSYPPGARLHRTRSLEQTERKLYCGEVFRKPAWNKVQDKSWGGQKKFTSVIQKKYTPFFSF